MPYAGRLVGKEGEMATCMICDREIGLGEDTFEHLIPQAIGGRQGVRGFIHRACNSAAGEKWDRELAVQLRPLSLMFDIRRQRGETPDLPIKTTANECFDLGPGGRLRHSVPVFNKTSHADGKSAYEIKARDLAEARRMLRGLKRKHPEINVDAALASARVEHRYAEGAVLHALGIGGPLSGRSIVKSLLAMAFATGLDWRMCDQAVHYIRDAKAEPSYGFYGERDLVVGRLEGMPIHCLAVRADPVSGLILAYAEYYGVYRIVACLGDGYSGLAIEGCYALDPRDGSTQRLRVDLPFSRADVDDIYAYRRVDREATSRDFEAVFGPALQAQLDREQERVIADAVQRAFDTCGARPGEILTQAHLHKISRSVAADVAPFLLQRLRPISPNEINAAKAQRLEDSHNETT